MRTSEPDCIEMELLLQADIDGELDAAASAAMAKHLMQCAHCAALQKNLLQLRQVLRRELPYEKPSADFAAALREKLNQSAASVNLDKNGLEKNSSQQNRPHKLHQQKNRWHNAGIFAGGAALAASLLLMLTPATQPALLDSVVSEHVRSLQADHLLDVVSTDQHTVKPWFNGKLDFVPPVDDFTDRGFTLEGGRLDYLDGRTVAALIYRHGKHPINLFVWPRNRSVVTSAADCTQVSGYHVCSWVRDDMNFWAVSDTSAAEMQQFVALWN
jgi:anti-sigma factor RsiW